MFGCLLRFVLCWCLFFGVVRGCLLLFVVLCCYTLCSSDVRCVLRVVCDWLLLSLLVVVGLTFVGVCRYLTLLIVVVVCCVLFVCWLLVVCC